MTIEARVSPSESPSPRHPEHVTERHVPFLELLGIEPIDAGKGWAAFALTMRSGFSTSGGHDVLLEATPRRGSHGYDPTHPELHASLIMSGPDVPKAGSLGVVRMTQIAPTIARWFGLSLSPDVDDPLPVSRPQR